MKKTILGAAFSIFTLASYSQTITRPKDPAILTGSQLPQYANESPSNLVAFKYQAGTWIQIPLQIDERELKDIVSGYGTLAATAGFPPSASNPKILFYSDANTHIGADSNPLFDADDELVFMIKDVGAEFTGTTLPTGVINGSCTQLKVVDGLPGGSGTWYVYLFKQDGTLQQNAGTSYVNLSSNVSSVSGWPAHINGLNTENTTVSSSNYAWHISAEWVSDELKLILGTNVDILDRHKNFFANGTCVRTENTFSDAENAYLVSKGGPVRIIRSVMGANSGPLTQRTHIFYKERIDITTDLRVHTIPSVYDAFDYNPAASGMEYRNNNNFSTPAIINGTGTSDGLVNNLLEWEYLNGTQGAISIVHRRITSIVASDNAPILSYYDDNSSSPASNCTGDGQAWGTSGWGTVFGNSITTDPVGDAGAGNLRNLQAIRIVYPAGPDQTYGDAAYHNAHAQYPLVITQSACTAGTSLGANISATEILCPDDSSVISVTTFDGTGNINYSWTHDANITGNTATVAAGQYQVIVSDDVDSVTLNVTVDAPESIDVGITFPNNTTAVADADSVQYLWINCASGQAIPGASGKTFFTNLAGQYALVITNAHGCTDTSACFQLGNIVSIQENPLSKHISLFPNPTFDVTRLDVDIENKQGMYYQITDISGRVISSTNITQKQTVIDVQQLATGVYIIKVKQENQDIKSIRFIKN